MKAYILSVIGAVFLLDTVSILIPHGKTGKLITGIVRLCSIVILLAPLLKIATDFKFTLAETSVQTDESFVDKSLCMRIEEYMLFYDNSLCKAVKLGNVVCVTFNNHRADEEELKEKIEDAFGVKAVFVYET